ncbi:hypothetical protein [Nafulsella turpanensis]|uniref:hypothetical protein n=1 Tax=Nafulsella turpanensis TaxID=1265690 RepID=UPI000349629A|nr:hypothetical protein [Nafulsella turpanensis]
MELHLKIVGAILILLGVMHIIFPKYFNWSKELSSLSLINRQMMYIHTFFIALVVLLMGVLCLTSSYELAGTPLGKRIAFGLGIFWVVRLVFQFVGYSSKLWKGKKFETTVHVVFIFLWTYLSTVFFGTYWL